jgi:hypothetical protein
VRVIVTILSVLFIVSCSDLYGGKYRNYPENTFKDIKTIAIAPFTSEVMPVDGLLFGNVFATELVKCKGFEVIRPLAVITKIRELDLKIVSIRDVINLAQSLGADAIIVGSVTDYDPYFPPKIAISIQIFRVKEVIHSAEEINKIIQRASWKPYPLSEDDIKNLVVALERVFDAHNEQTRNEVEIYAMAQGSQETAFSKGEEFLRIKEKFWQFASCQMIFEILKTGIK